ncbi:MAG: hypothetical protein Q9209_006826 [Squamulea sp. 1 TL-2023]
MGDCRSNSDAVIARDVTCRMTDYIEECDIAHLCPKTEVRWFQANRMDLYIMDLRRSGSVAIHDKANVMLLRADVHRAYDKMRFVHLPKRHTTGELRFVTHLMHHSTELGQLYHNAELHTLGVAKEFLFTRLAYAVFPLLAGFLQQGVKRYLLQAFADEPAWAPPDQCYQYSEEWKPANQRSSCTPSPTKRSRTDAGIEETPSGVDINGSTANRGRHDGPPETHAPYPASERRPSSGKAELTTINPTTSEPSPAQTKPGEKAINQSTKNDPYELPPPERSLSQSSTSDPLPETTHQHGHEHNEELAAMCDLYLQKERARSDGFNYWDKEQRWLQGVFDRGGALDASEMKRFAMAMGYDVIDDVEVQQGQE